MAEFVRHTSCDKCGSSDGRAVYSDGSFFCWVCNDVKPSKDLLKGKAPMEEQEKKSKPVITEEQKAEVKERAGYTSENYRGIRADTYKKFGVRHSVSDSDKLLAQYYPVTQDGELVGYKIRELPKHFGGSLGRTGAECDLFGQFMSKKSAGKFVIITEGECLLPSTKVLTKNGWVSLDEYSEENGEVMQGDGTFALPIAKVFKDYSGEILTYISGSYEISLTPNHNMIRLDKNGNQFKAKAFDSTKNHYNIPRVVQSLTKANDLMTRLQVMFSADFTFRDDGDIYGRLKKIRKINRCKMLLDAAGVRYSSCASKGYTSFFIHRGHNLDVSKEFSYKRDLPNASTIIDELVHWDGNTVPNRNQIEYSSKLIHNARFIQTCAHISGFTSTIIPRSNNLGNWLKVSILFGKNSSSTQKGYSSTVYSGKVACLTMPAGSLLVSQNDSISVTGNCDAMSAYQMINDYNKQKGWDVETPVVSPTIGSNCKKQIAGQYEFFKKFEKIYISFDNDEAGQKVIDDLISVLPKGKVYVMKTRFKDANEFLKNGKEKEYIQDFWDAKQYVPAGVVASSDLYDRIVSQSELQKVTLPPFAKKLQEMLGGGFVLGHIYNIAAMSGIGKTSVVNEFIYHWIFHSPYTVGVVSMELNAGQYGEAMLSRHIQQKLARLTVDEKAQTLNTEFVKSKATELFFKEDGSPRFFLVDDRDGTVDQLKHTIEEMIIGSGVKLVVLDVLQDIMEGMTNEEQGLFMKWVKSMIKSHNVCFVLINHMRKKQDGTSTSKVDESDIHGSSTILKSASANILLTRDKGAEDEIKRNTTDVTLSKNRLLGDTGPAGRLYYDKMTHVMHDFDDYFVNGDTKEF